MHLKESRDLKQKIIDFLTYNWFLIVPLLMILAFINIKIQEELTNKMFKVYKLLELSSSREIVSTTDGRVALAQRVKLIKKGDSWKLPEKVNEVLINNKMDNLKIEKMLKEFSKGGASVQ